jgi:trehalose 6-phosphate phosphatase
MTVLLDRLAERIDDVAAAQRLLVACDLDGTIADLVSDPAAARLRDVAKGAVRELAALPDTVVAIVSGRSLDDLRAVVGEIAELDRVRLFGSHGLEADDGTVIGMARAASTSRDDLVRRVARIVAQFPGARCEPKPYGAAVHHGRLGPEDASRMRRAIDDLLDQDPSLFWKPGKHVLDISVLPLYKPFAVDTLQHRWEPTTTIYAGDDTTDEDVFAALWPGDIGIKIGMGPTAAGYRTPSTRSFETLLVRLAARRRVLRGA